MDQCKTSPSLSFARSLVILDLGFWFSLSE